jgi:hypothetical protein
MQNGCAGYMSADIGAMFSDIVMLTVVRCGVFGVRAVVIVTMLVVITLLFVA